MSLDLLLTLYLTGHDDLTTIFIGFSSINLPFCRSTTSFGTRLALHEKMKISLFPLAIDLILKDLGIKDPFLRKN
jgi:hypothetical protein